MYSKKNMETTHHHYRNHHQSPTINNHNKYTISAILVFW